MGMVQFHRKAATEGTALGPGRSLRTALRTFGEAVRPLLTAFAIFLATAPLAGAVTVERTGNHLVITGKIGVESPSVFNRNLVDALLELAVSGDRESPVHLHLDLPSGGVAFPAFELVDLIRSAQAEGTEFVAHVGAGSTCMSGCTFLFLASDQRWISAEGRLVFHGFSQKDPARPVKVPQRFHDAYYGLLKAANEPFYRFFKQARIIEDDIKVGFTGKTLFEQGSFAGLITGLTAR